MELSKAGLNFQRQFVVPVLYKGTKIGEHRLDLVVEDKIIIELKTVDRFDPVMMAQVLAYLKVTGKRLGLLFNFNTAVLMDEGFKRVVL